MLGQGFLKGEGESLFLAFGVVEALEDFVDKLFCLVVLHIKLVLQFLVFLFGCLQTSLSILYSLSEFIGFVGHMNEIILEVIILLIKLTNLLLQKLDFIKQLLLLML